MTENSTELRAEARLAEIAEQAITAVLRIPRTARKPLLPGCPAIHPAPARPAHRPLIPVRFGRSTRDRQTTAPDLPLHRPQLAPPRSGHPLHLAVGDRADHAARPPRPSWTPVMPGRLVAPAPGTKLAGPSRTGTLGCACAREGLVPPRRRQVAISTGAVMLSAAESLGLRTLAAATTGVYVVGGKPSLFAEAMLGMLPLGGLAVPVIDRSATRGAVAMWRRAAARDIARVYGSPSSGHRRLHCRARGPTGAGRGGNDSTCCDPRTMLMWRAVSIGCRLEGARLMKGMRSAGDGRRVALDAVGGHPPPWDPAALRGIRHHRAPLQRPPPARSPGCGS